MISSGSCHGPGESQDDAEVPPEGGRVYFAGGYYEPVWGDPEVTGGKHTIHFFPEPDEQGAEFPQVASEDPQVARGEPGWLLRLFNRWRREP